MRVFRNPDGRIVRIGTEDVIYGPGNKPEWVGKRRVGYNGHGRIQRVGGDLVRYGNDGRPVWVGGARVW
jgi:hypothetical protein